MFKSRSHEILSAIDIEHNNIHDSVNEYEAALCQLIDDLCPKTTKTVMERENSPWYNDEIRDAKQLRRRLERRWRKSRLPADRILYQEQRHRVIQLMEEAKTEFFSSAVDQCSSDQKALYKIVDELLHRKGAPILPTSASDPELAEQFSCYFESKVVNIRNDLHPDDVSQNLPTAYTDPAGPSSESRLNNFSPVSEEEVKRLILQSPNKSCNMDPLPTWLIKDHADVFAPFFTKLINKMFLEGHFPDNLKHAAIKPLLKKNNLDRDVLSTTDQLQT